MFYRLAGALLLGYGLAFGWHLPAWAKREPGSGRCDGLVDCVVSFFNPGGAQRQDWRAVVAAWSPGRTFCVVRVVCFPVQMQRYEVVPGGRLFAPRPGRVHYGVDFSGMDYGAPVYAPFNGQVAKVMRGLGACGDGLEIHTGSLIVRFCHVGPTVQAGQQVYAGQVIGHINRSGSQSGPHLHMETYVNGQVVSFEDFLKNLPQVAQVILASGVPDERTGVLAASGTEVWDELSRLGEATRGRLCSNPISDLHGWVCYNHYRREGNQALASLALDTANVPLPSFSQLLSTLSERQQESLSLPPPFVPPVDARLQRDISGFGLVRW